jgi:hypothetical protein
MKLVMKVGKVNKQPVTVAERSKACTVFARSEAAIVGSNPTWHGCLVFVYVRFSVFMCR